MTAADFLRARYAARKHTPFITIEQFGLRLNPDMTDIFAASSTERPTAGEATAPPASPAFLLPES